MSPARQPSTPQPSPSTALSRLFEPEIARLAKEWLDHPARLRVDPEVLACWDELVRWWVEDSELPLPIRTSSDRGKQVRRRGIQMIYTDNSPAQWIFARAASEHWMPSNDELEQAVRREMPVALAPAKKFRNRDEFSTALANGPSTQALGWRLCHKQAVAAGARSLERLSPDALRERARRLIDPRNMFVVPSACRGIGENDAFIAIMRTEDLTCHGSIGRDQR